MLSERNVGFGEDDDLKTASQHLPFLPPTASGEAEVRDSLKRTLGGLSTAIQGICELRNKCGFASHGSGTPRPSMESVQALMAAEAADTIVGFLHRVHKQDRTSPNPPNLSRKQYDDNPEFNESVDEAHGTIRIYEIEFRPSEVLFHLEPVSYRVYLAEFAAEAGDTEGAAAEDGSLEAAP